MIAWYRVLNEAANEFFGGINYLIAKSISDDCMRNDMLVESARIGEFGEERLVDGEYPSDILRKLRELLESKAIPIPSSIYRLRGERAWSN
jgi:hypothetical protein